jgi:hypothetical protein
VDVRKRVLAAVLIAGQSVAEVRDVTDEVGIAVRHPEQVLIKHRIAVLVRTLVVTEAAALVVGNRVRAEEAEHLRLVRVLTLGLIHLGGLVGRLIHLGGLTVLPVLVHRRGIKRLSTGNRSERGRKDQRSDGGKKSLHGVPPAPKAKARLRPAYRSLVRDLATESLLLESAAFFASR